MRKADWRKYKTAPEYFSSDGLAHNEAPLDKDGEVEELEYEKEEEMERDRDEEE